MNGIQPQKKTQIMPNQLLQAPSSSGTGFILGFEDNDENSLIIDRIIK
jgi:hypothetical protein